MLTLEELAIISLFTDCTLVEGEDLGYLYKTLEKFEGRPVYTHEIPELAKKHRDKIAEMVRTIYDRAKAQSKFEKILADEAERTANVWKNLLTDPPEPAKAPIGNLTCDSCLAKDKNGEFCNKYCKVKDKE